MFIYFEENEKKKKFRLHFIKGRENKQEKNI